MNAREIQSAFKAASWNTTQELQTFVETAKPAVDGQLLLKLLEVMVKSESGQGQRADMRAQAFRGLGSGATDPGLFIPFVRALRDAGPRGRLALADLIPAVNNIQAHDQLVVLLRASEAPLRKAAAVVIEKIGGKSIVQMLGKMVTDTGLSGRREAIELVVKLAGHYAITPLETMLRSKVPVEDKILAIQFIGDPQFMAKGTSRATGVLVQVVEAGDPALLPTALAALGQVGSEDEYMDAAEPHFDHDHINIARAAIEGLARFGSRRTMNLLDRKFRLGPNSIRLAVVNTLEMIGTDEVLPSLVDALKYPDLSVRNTVSETIGRLSQSGRVDIARTVLWLLRTGDVNLRRIGVELARTVPDPDKLWPKMLAFLRDEDWWVREQVVETLIDMAGRKLAEHIVGYLKDPSAVLRRFAVDVLARMQDPKAVELFSHIATNDQDWWVRERAIEAMATLNDPNVVAPIVSMLPEPELRIVCLFALSELNAVQAAPQVAEYLSDELYDVQWAALHCLSTIGGPAHAKQVEPLVEHEHKRIKKFALDLLRRWRTQTGGGPVSGKISALDRFLFMLLEQKGDDLMLSAGQRPFLKKLGSLSPLSDTILPGNLIEDMIFPLLSGAQLTKLDQREDIDLSYEVDSMGGRRFRVNVFYTVKGLTAVFRKIEDRIANFDELGVPDLVRTFGDYKNGLVLIGGPTGSGKSTTLAALINYINENYDRHIVSLEDPIEVVHHPIKALINQRELGTHINSYSNALRAALRQDPDVLLVGELRDFETIKFAVTAAETGHLVFGTVHTVSAHNTVERMMNAFPSGLQGQVRAMLSESLRAVLCQHLLRRVDGPGRILAAEIMLCNDAVSNMIRKGKAHQIPALMTTSRSLGMQLMDDHLWQLYKAGKVSAEEAYLKSTNKTEFQQRFESEQSRRGAAGQAQAPLPPPMAGAPTRNPHGTN